MLKHFQEFDINKYFEEIKSSFKLKKSIKKAFVNLSFFDFSLFLLKKHLRLLRQNKNLNRFVQDLMFLFHKEFSSLISYLKFPENQIETNIAFYTKLLKYKGMLKKYRISDDNFDEFLGKFNLSIFVEMASKIFSEIAEIKNYLLSNFGQSKFLHFYQIHQGAEGKMLLENLDDFDSPSKFNLNNESNHIYKL